MCEARGSRFPKVIVAAGLALALAACSSSDQRQAQGKASDALIATTVKAKLATIDAATLSLVDVSSVDGVVTLTGRVPSADLKNKAHDAARTTDGVKSVDDRLIVDPNAPTGQQIAGDIGLQSRINARLVGQIGVNAGAVTVGVHKGVVDLGGSVRTRALHDVAVETVRTTPGVKRVNDKLTVEH